VPVARVQANSLERSGTRRTDRVHRVDRLDSQRRRLRRDLWQSADESKYRAALA
jgi:hypothetical protein